MTWQDNVIDRTKNFYNSIQRLLRKSLESCTGRFVIHLNENIKSHQYYLTFLQNIHWSFHIKALFKVTNGRWALQILNDHNSFFWTIMRLVLFCTWKRIYTNLTRICPNVKSLEIFPHTQKRSHINLHQI